MSPPPLPYDLYCVILDNVDSSADLMSIALCCQLLALAGQRALFRHPKPASYEQHMRFLDAIIASPNRLALYVLAYSQHSPIIYTCHGVRRPENPALLLQKTECAIPLMKNLKKLRYVPVIADGDPDPEIRLRTDFPFQLETFEWGGITMPIPVLEAFIQAHPKIRHLALECRNGKRLDMPTMTYNISSDTCPGLRSLHAGTWEVVRGILPGRRITQLTVLTDGWQSESLGGVSQIAQISTELGRLRYLAFDTGPSGRPLASIAHYLHSLKHLELWTMENFEDLTMYTLPQLAKLPSLTTLVLSSRPLNLNLFICYHDCTKPRIVTEFVSATFGQVKPLQMLYMEVMRKTLRRYTRVPSKKRPGEFRITLEPRIKAGPIYEWREGILTREAYPHF